jgi:hypothetical protein
MKTMSSPVSSIRDETGLTLPNNVMGYINENILNEFNFSFSFPESYNERINCEIDAKVKYFFSQKNYDERRIDFKILRTNSMYGSKVSITSKNLYTALLFDGIEDPDSYVAAGFHKLLDGGKYSMWG